MGFFYSLGISFNAKEEAQECKILLDQKTIVLSDSTQIKTSVFVQQTCYSNYSEYAKALHVVHFYPEGLETPRTNDRLFTRPYFYEIRAYMYKLLTELTIPFIYALYESEGADHIGSEDCIEVIKKEGIGPVRVGDPNASYFSGQDAGYFDSKRYWDGLIISNSVFPFSDPNFAKFKEFRSGYMWMPFPVHSQK